MDGIGKMPRVVIITHPSFDRQNGSEIIRDYIENMRQGILATLAAAKDAGFNEIDLKALSEHLSKFRFFVEEISAEKELTA